MYIQARSQDLEKGGGAILKEWEVCKRPRPEFSLLLNQFHTVCTKIETKFLGNSKVFSAQNQVVSKKKKKGLHRFWDWIFGPNLKFKAFFRPKSGGLQKKKKKKGLRRFWDWLFGPTRKSKRLRGGLFSYGGGLFSVFHWKSTSKPPKRWDFAYYTSQWGGSSQWGGLEPKGGSSPPPPAPPGYATVYITRKLLTNKRSLLTSVN